MHKNFNLKISILITVVCFVCSVIIYYIQNNKYSIDAFVYKAEHNFANESYFQAAKYYKKLISMGVLDEDIYINTAISFIKIGNYQKAIKYLNKFKNKQSHSYRIYYFLGYSYYIKAQNSKSKKDFITAAEYLIKSLELNNKDKDSYQLLGTIYELLNQFEHARTWYRKALFEDIDNSSEFYGFIANTYFKENRFEDAIKYYTRAIENNKNYISAYCSMAKIYDIKDNFDKSKKYYKKAIKINPDYIYPYYQIGNLYYKKQKYKKAVKWYMKALKIEKNNNIVNYCIGITYKKLNMLEESIKYLKQAAYCGNDDAVKELRTMLQTF